MKLAINWLKKAASQGHPQACNDLGSLYMRGVPGNIIQKTKQTNKQTQTK
jgi:TPR repeat protein